MRRNQNPLFASIRVHWWFIRALVPTANRRESTFLEVKLQGLHDYELFVGNLGEARLIEA